MKVLAALVSLLVVLGFSGVSLADVAAGQKTYESKCKSCHGKAGEGNPAIAKVLKVDATALALKDSKKTDEELASEIKAGKDKMPAFKEKLSDDEIKDVVSYVRSLSQQK